MRYITLDLIRKRSEHNEGLTSNLEEIALHQEELQAIGPILGKASGKTLKILLLQNNVIGPEMDLMGRDMRGFKRLEYLNLALNNVEVVTMTGLSDKRLYGHGHGWEFLNKLDLTLNFIRLDRFQETVDCLSTLRSLKELFMMGNPCMSNCKSGDSVSDVDYTDGDGNSDGTSQGNKVFISPPISTANDDDGVSTTCSNRTTRNNIPQNKPYGKGAEKGKNIGWKYARIYLIAKIPQLEYLDGTQITKSERIKANQMLHMHKLERELETLARECKEEQEKTKTSKSVHDTSDSDVIGEEEVTTHCPRDRLRLGNELSQQKAEKEANDKANQPKFKSENVHEKEQKNKVKEMREKEEGIRVSGDEDQIKQCNEGRFYFEFNEKKKPGCLALDISIQKHLSSSLIDVDVHPTFVTVVIKSKVLRLRLPVEVRSEASSAQRSMTTGHLLVIMPKCDPNRFNKRSTSTLIYDYTSNRNRSVLEDSKKIEKTSMPALTGPVNVRGLVEERYGGIKPQDSDAIEKKLHSMDMVEQNTIRKKNVITSGCDFEDGSTCSDDELPPPLV